MQIVIVSGVSGTGKSTVGRIVAARLGYRFADADDFHSPANVEKMRSGLPLDESDRRPWLASLASFLNERAAEDASTVLACSALKRAHRDVLRAGREAVTTVVELVVDATSLESRLRARAGHFFRADLLPSQLAAREASAPEEGVVLINAAPPIEAVVESVLTALRTRSV